MKPTQRALRVGVLLGNHLVEERVFRSDGAPITFGQSLRCTLSVPAAGVPAEHTLFALEQGRFLLRVTAQMTGRLAQNGELSPLPQEQVIPLAKGARGKLSLGEATILFQEIAAPPIAPRPQLPASVRGTFADRIDRRLATIVAVSLLAHLVIASWAWMTEREGADTAGEAVAEYEAPKYDVIDLFVPDVVAPANPTEPGIAAPVAPTQTPSPIVPKQDVHRLPEPLDVDRWANAITGNEVGKNGQTEIAKRVPNTDLDKQIQQIRDTNGNIKIGGNRTSRDRDPRLGNGPDGPTIGDPTLDRVTKHEKPPVTRITPVPMPRPPGKDPLPIALVLGRIQNAYMAGLQRCYVKHGLATDATMVAKVTLTFTVDVSGRSTENQARGANPAVDGCIRDQMTGWQFPIPKDTDGDPTDAPFKLVLALQPS